MENFSGRKFLFYSVRWCVYSAIIKMKNIYPDGMTWTNDEPYGEKGDKDRYMPNALGGGRGCAAFAYELSDAALGMLPAMMYATN